MSVVGQHITRSWRHHIGLQLATVLVLALVLVVIAVAIVISLFRRG